MGSWFESDDTTGYKAKVMTYSIRNLTADLSTDMYLTFMDAFSDYALPFTMSKKQFVDKFIMKLQIDFDLSVGAFDDKGGLSGFIFTSVGDYAGKKTAYNGGTGVRPRSRGDDLAYKMYTHLLPLLKSLGIQQCVLEVLVQNTKAQEIYKKLGFQTVRLLKCYKLKNPRTLSKTSTPYITKVPLADWATYESFFSYTPAYLDSIRILKPTINKEQHVLEAHKDNTCVGYILFHSTSGRISQLAVHPQYRKMGIGRALISSISTYIDGKPIYILNIPESAVETHGFFTAIGFDNEIDQYEMILSL